jgi:Putative redox-active protein (C_GCAxxG_C_C)
MPSVERFAIEEQFPTLRFFLSCQRVDGLARRRSRPHREGKPCQHKLFFCHRQAPSAGKDTRSGLVHPPKSRRLDGKKRCPLGNFRPQTGIPLDGTRTTRVSFLASDLLWIGSSRDVIRLLRLHSLANLSRMGHCAPTVMQTLLDASETEAEWLVKLTAGLPGGIGNTGMECGGITAPLVLLGLRHAGDPLRDGVPVVIYKGHDLLKRFTACHHTTQCIAIRGDEPLPLQCLGVILQAPKQYAEADSRSCSDVISAHSKNAYACLHAHLVSSGFHCTGRVFNRLHQTIPVNQELLNGGSGFVGGTVFTGMTCGAFTAGVMALGLALGEIEHSRIRVLRMFGRMATGGDAFADELNAFNRIMNLAHRLSEWFASQFGNLQCRAITQCDFSTTVGVRQYIDCNRVRRCEEIAEKVALKVEDMIHHASS